MLSTANSTFYIDAAGHDNSAVPWVFRLGFMYYSLLGTIIAVLAGTVISYATGGQQKPISDRLLTPWVRSWYKSVRSVDDYEYKQPPQQMQVLLAVKDPAKIHK